MGDATAVMTLGNDYDVSRAVGLMARIAKINGVQFVDFNYTTNKIIVDFDPGRVGLQKLKEMVTRERAHLGPSTKRRSRNRVSEEYT